MAKRKPLNLSLINDYNNKIDELSQIPEYSRIVPPKIDTSDIGEYSARDLRDLERRAKNFLKPGADDIVTNDNGVRTLRFTLRELTTDVNRINKERELERERLSRVGNRGSRANIMLNESYGLPDMQFDFNNYDRQYGFNKRAESLMNMGLPDYFKRRDSIYKDNYIRSLLTVFGSTPDLAELIDKLDQLSADDFVNAYLSNPYYLNIDFIYDRKEAQAILDKIIDEWDAYIATLTTNAETTNDDV